MNINHHKSELYFLLFLLLAIFILAFYIFQPFLYSLILAIVFATVFEPLHNNILVRTNGRKGLSALLATICVLLVVIVPLSFLGIQIFREATDAYSYLAESNNASDLSHTITGGIQRITAISPFKLEFNVDINQYARQGLNWLLQNTGSFFSNAAKALMGIFIFLLALYYVFKDGHKLKRAVIGLSPLKDIHDETIFHKLALAINSVTRGNLTVALIQGFVTALGFILFGVPSAALWGSVAAIAALVPTVGTALVTVPAVIYLYVSGTTLLAGALLIWGIVAVGLIDNFVGPKLVERGTKLHPFLILLSILGGIGFFGPLGFLLGPIILSLLFAFLEIYVEISKEQKVK
ncbi:MAG: AI-2E family transporter [bacterium]|nr:AI-2E family transporter [bacterium]